MLLKHRENQSLSLSLSFSQEEEKEALTLNEQREAGCAAPVHLTYTSIELKLKDTTLKF